MTIHQPNIMKKKHLLLANFLLCSVLATAQEAPFYSVNFNEDSQKVEFQNNAARGPAGSGVSGKPEDCAYVAKATGVPTEPQPGAFLQDFLSEELTNSTLTFWYKTDTGLKNTSLLCSFGGIYLITDGKGGWVARCNLKTDKPTRNWVHISENGPVTSWATTDWVFGAITWNSESRTISIYQGDKLGGVQLQKAYPDMSVEGPLMTGTWGVVGNMARSGGTSPKLGDRPFDGSIDNICVYKSELTPTELEAVRVAGLENKIP